MNTHPCAKTLLRGIPDHLLASGGDLGDLIDHSLAQICHWGHDSRAMPWTWRLIQARGRLYARLGVIGPDLWEVISLSQLDMADATLGEALKAVTHG